MNLKKRLTTGAAALFLAIGGMAALPAAAAVEEPELISSGGHASQSDCEFAKSVTTGVLVGTGATFHGGQDCAENSDGTWGYTLLVKR